MARPWARCVYTLGVLLATLAVTAAAAQPATPAEQPLLVVELGSHSAPVRRLDVHPGRGLVVTASDDRTARVWDLASGELRHVLRPLAQGNEVGRLYGAAIHPSEPLVAVAGTSGGAASAHLIYLFDLDTGALRRTIDARAGDIRKLAWSADGSVLLAGYNGTHGLRAFALDGRELLDDRFDGAVFGIGVSSSGLAAAVGLSGELRNYRVGGGAAVALARTTMSGRRPFSVAFSPDGARLAVAYATPREGPELFDGSDLRSLGRLAAEPIFGGDWRVLAWSADGRTLHVGGTAYTQALRFPVVSYDVASSKSTAVVDVAGDSVTDLVALPSGELAWTSFDGSWGVLGAGRVQRRVGAPLATVRGNTPLDLEISADARALRWGTQGVHGGIGFAFERRRLQPAPKTALTPPQTSFSALNAPSDWNHESRRPVIGGRTMTLALDERGRSLAVLRGAAPAAFVGTNRALYRVSDQGAVVWRVAVDTEIRALNTSADGRLVVSAMADGTVRWWRAGDGRLLLTLLAQADGRWVVWTPAGYYDASAGADRLVGWALPGGQQQAMSYFSLNRFRDRFNRPDVIDAMFTHLDEGAALAALAAREEQARLVLERQAREQAAAAHAAERAAAEQARQAAQREAELRAAVEQAAHEAALRAEATRVEQARRAEAERLAQAEAARAAERETARLVAEAQAAALRDAARREAALEAQRVAASLELARVAAARKAAERDEAVRAAAREAAEREAAAQARKTLQALKAIEFPPTLQAVAAPRMKTVAAEVSLPFEMRSPAGAGEVSVQLRVNGRPATADVVMAQSVEGRSQGMARLSVGEGRSQIEIIAGNRYGLSEAIAYVIERETAQRPPSGPLSDLYVLAVGVADYQRPEYKLGLAAKDARDFAATMKRQEGRLYRRVIVRTLTDAQATRAAVLRELDALQAGVTATDVAMVFIAGHGINDASGNYFFIPHDGQHERLATTAVPQAAIVGGLSRVKGKTILFVDTCFAGNALGALSKTERQTERLINDLSSSENGVVVFASSTGHEESEEKDEWGNGAFTKALLEGLSGKADFMRAGRVTYTGLNLYVSEEVTRLTAGRQRPVFISPRGIPDFAVARL